MGIWLKIERADSSDLDLQGVRSQLQAFPDVREVEPKMLTEAQAYELGQDTDNPPHIEFHRTAFIFHIHWADNRYSHLQRLLETLLEHNAVQGHCYDGYHHPD